MTERKEITELEWILKKLNPLYKIQKAEEESVRVIIEHGYGREEIYKGYYIYVEHLEGITKHLTFRSGSRSKACIDMLSTSIQVKDFGDFEYKVFIGEQEAKIENAYVNGNGPNFNTILIYSDYASLREHFFEKDELVQVAQWVRNDTARLCLDWGKYGKYVLSVNVCNPA